MPDWLQYLLLIVVGLVLLVGGGELLVRGASALARLARVGPLVIGLTVVAFGTSAPELATSLGAAFSGKVDLAIGNVVGSNIANVLLILGVASLIMPLKVQSRLVRLDVPLLVVAGCVLLAMAWNGNISRVEGAFLVTAIVIYTIWLIRQSRYESAAVTQEFADALPPVEGHRRNAIRQLVLLVVGLGLLVIGAKLLVDGASDLARGWGVSELTIGLTIVAIGTSLPELMASVMAALRGESDIAVGNVVGSSLFNILSVLGATALIAPGGIDVSVSAIQFDIPLMILVSLVCLPVFLTGWRVSRWEGAVFVVCYITYLVYLLNR
ncbi:calcium/sodium antiporter [Stieleria sp. TO1_6]|uniref:calcium/sodium antiporter n=1 Tax=Stieleria tagensis TaxID=2956795 RepID=UPI00209B06C1|nr:calcium/sodium antiporter [Stieleria tagensis]MCO8125177.1 calcium/sodium antiporter [Stieleria tagensis]